MMVFSTHDIHVSGRPSGNEKVSVFLDVVALLLAFAYSPCIVQQNASEKGRKRRNASTHPSDVAVKLGPLG